MMRRICAMALAAIAAVQAASAISRAHDAPAGWTYPFACCSNMDCRQVPASAVREPTSTSHGYVIHSTGELIPNGDSRIKVSPDGQFHWCAVQAGTHAGETICLFVPPKGF